MLGTLLILVDALILTESCEQPDIIHETPDQILVAVRRIVHDQKTVLADLLARDFNLKFVYFLNFGPRLSHEL